MGSAVQFDQVLCGLLRLDGVGSARCPCRRSTPHWTVNVWRRGFIVALWKKGKWWYSDAQSDIRGELARVGDLNEYVPTQFADAKCACGNRTFQLALDEDTGTAVRTCSKCKADHPIGDSDEYLEDADLQKSSCVCGKDVFEITIGVSLYDDSDDVSWLYVGCRCPSCCLTGCYGDWKNEFIDYRQLLKQV